VGRPETIARRRPPRPAKPGSEWPRAYQHPSVRGVVDTIPATGVLGAYFPIEIFRLCFRKCRRNVRFKKRELRFIRRMLKADISPQKSAIMRFSAGFSDDYFPIRICRVFFVGNDALPHGIVQSLKRMALRCERGARDESVGLRGVAAGGQQFTVALRRDFSGSRSNAATRASGSMRSQRKALRCGQSRDHRQKARHPDPRHRRQ
jgi:hypothetical protein